MMEKNTIEPIVDIKKFTKECRGVVAKALGNDYVGFSKPQNIVDNKVLCVMTAPGSTSAKDKYSYRVIPIYSSVDKIFWLGASLEFQCRQGKDFLVGASIIIFEGDAADEEKIPLLRAEWEITETTHVKHAQPHWHIYAGRINPQPSKATFDEETVEFGSDQTVTEPTFDTFWEDTPRFHFAMSSQWHLAGPQPIYVHLDRMKITNWLYGCITYTIDQIKWLNS